MSLLSPERLLVSLSPERMSAVRLVGRWRPRRLDERSVSLPGTGAPPWTPGLEALELLLDEPAWGGRELSVILASHFVHYALLPGGKQLAAVEQADLGRLIFRNIFGELARDWVLRISPAGKMPTLASGVPKSLLSDLQAACEGRAVLNSIQPGLMTVFNRVRVQIDQHSGLLALVEAGRITLARIETGQWQSIVSRAWEADALPALLAEIQSLSGSAGQPGGRLWLCDLTGKAVVPSDPGWQLERLVSGAAGAASLAAWGSL